MILPAGAALYGLQPVMQPPDSIAGDSLTDQGGGGVELEDGQPLSGEAPGPAALLPAEATPMDPGWTKAVRNGILAPQSLRAQIGGSVPSYYSSACAASIGLMQAGLAPFTSAYNIGRALPRSTVTGLTYPTPRTPIGSGVSPISGDHAGWYGPWISPNLAAQVLGGDGRQFQDFYEPAEYWKVFLPYLVLQFLDNFPDKGQCLVEGQLFIGLNFDYWGSQSVWYSKTFPKPYPSPGDVQSMTLNFLDSADTAAPDASNLPAASTAFGAWSGTYLTISADFG